MTRKKRTPKKYKSNSAFKIQSLTRHRYRVKINRSYDYKKNYKYYFHILSCFLKAHQSGRLEKLYKFLKNQFSNNLYKTNVMLNPSSITFENQPTPLFKFAIDNNLGYVLEVFTQYDLMRSFDLQYAIDNGKYDFIIDFMSSLKLTKPLNISKVPIEPFKKIFEKYIAVHKNTGYLNFDYKLVTVEHMHYLYENYANIFMNTFINLKRISKDTYHYRYEHYYENGLYWAIKEGQIDKVRFFVDNNLVKFVYFQQTRRCFSQKDCGNYRINSERYRCFFEYMIMNDIKPEIVKLILSKKIIFLFTNNVQDKEIEEYCNHLHNLILENDKVQYMKYTIDHFFIDHGLICTMIGYGATKCLKYLLNYCYYRWIVMNCITSQLNNDVTALIIEYLDDHVDFKSVLKNVSNSCTLNALEWQKFKKSLDVRLKFTDVLVDKFHATSELLNRQIIGDRELTTNGYRNLRANLQLLSSYFKILKIDLPKKN